MIIEKNQREREKGAERKYLKNEIGVKEDLINGGKKLIDHNGLPQVNNSISEHKCSRDGWFPLQA